MPGTFSLLIPIGLAVWAAFDANKIGLSRYKSGLHSPIFLFIGMLGIWFVAFPWYLTVRARILRGEAELKGSNSMESMGFKSMGFILLSILSILLIIISITFTHKILLELAQSHYSQNRYADAIQKLDDLLKKQPENIDALILRGKAKYRNGDRQGGVNDFQEAIKLDDSQRWSVSSFLNEVGDEKYRVDDYEGAINDYNHAIRLNPNDARGCLWRGKAKQNLGDNRGAIPDYDRAIELNPNHFIAYFERAMAKEALGDYRGAIQDYDRTIELEPGLDIVVYNRRGHAKVQLGNYRGAIRDYNRAIQLDPDNAGAYKNRGIAKLKSGDKYGAREDLLHARELYQERGDTESVSDVDSWLRAL